MRDFWGFVRPAGNEPSSGEHVGRAPGWLSDGRLHVAGVAAGDLAGTAGGVRVLARARFDDRSVFTARLSLPSACTASDIVLAAYRRWGRDFAAELRGDFAAAIWDPTRDELLCAVDGFGIGSLFFVHPPGGVRGFSSQLSRAGELPGVRLRVDLEVIGRYVCQLPTAPEKTSFRDVHRVGPGSHVCLGGSGTVRVTRYWSLGAIESVRFPKDQDYIDAFRERLDRAVERRLPGGRVALSLSAGLDSAAILGVAQALGRSHDLLALTGTPSQPECNEQAEVAALGDAFGTRSIWVEPETTLQAFSDACRISGEPRYLTHFPITLAVARRAALEGAQRLLTGMYGDLVGGTVWHRALLPHLLRSGHLSTWLREVTALPRRARRRMTIASALGALPYVDALRSKGRVAQLLPSWWPITALEPSALAELGLAEARREFAVEVDRWTHDFVFSRRGWLERTLMFESEFAGRVAAECGLELAHPFADRDLVSLSLALPARLLSHEGLTRAPLRFAMSGRVPDFVRLRRNKVLFNRMYQEMIARLGRELGKRPLASSLEPLIRWQAVQETLGAAKSHAEYLHAWRCLAVNAWMLDHHREQNAG